MSIRTRVTLSPRSNASGRKPGCAFTFGILWTLFSCFFVVIGIILTSKSLHEAGWQEVLCTIERFEIRDDHHASTPFTADVLYHYAWQGETFSSTQLDSDRGQDSSYEKLAGLRAQFPPGAQAFCRVNPENPQNAVLRHDGTLTWVGIVFTIVGACFLLFGLAMVIGVFRQIKHPEAPSSKSLSSPHVAKKSSTAFVPFVFFLLFGLAGCGTLFGLSVPAWKRYFAAHAWVETPAEVIWSKVRDHRGKKGSTTYSADIFYRYTFNGIEHRSNTRSFITGSSSGYSGKNEIVKQHPPGRKISCFVNPEQPWQAILDRSLGWWGLITLLPLPFLAVGFFGLNSLRKKSKNAAAPAAASSPAFSAGESAALSLRPEASSSVESKTFNAGGSRRTKCLVLSLLGLFWNGLVSVFVMHAYEAWRNGSPDWFLNVFLIPFVLIGLGLVIAVLKALLGLFAPRPALILEPGDPILGQTAILRWQIRSSFSRIQRLRLYLVGLEKATYKRGTDTSTDYQIFHEQLLVDTDSILELHEGQCQFQLTRDTSPSWQGKHNAVQWSLRLRANLPFMPDVSDDFDITVKAP